MLGCIPIATRACKITGHVHHGGFCYLGMVKLQTAKPQPSHHLKIHS